MIAYKFLRSEGVGPFSGFRWPTPGVWVRADGEMAVCGRGIHACRTTDLPWWLADDLWEIELDGQVQFHEHKVLAPAGRLLSRVEGWTPSCAQKYADACAWRAHQRAVEALTRDGHATAAGELAACTTLDDVLAVAARLAEAIPDAQIILTIAGRGAFRAITGAPPMSAYIAAHAARRLDGPDGYADERAWQTNWLVEQLGLRADL
jgi:hypothetical protein